MYKELTEVLELIQKAMFADDKSAPLLLDEADKKCDELLKQKEVKYSNKN